MATDRRRPTERGSTLMLMPLAVLVVLILAAIAVDMSVVFMRQRELVAAAQAAANDAAGYGLDQDSFYSGNRVELDLGRAQTAATAAMRARGIEDPPLVRLDTDRTHVVVEIHSTVPTLFSKAVPGAPDSMAVEAQASADLPTG